MSKFNLRDTFDQEVELRSELANQTYQSHKKVFEKTFHYRQLVANEKNRELKKEKVRSIAESIIVNDRIIDKPQVTLLEDGNALIWAGHHRVAAIRYLVEERGLTKFEYIKCDVSPSHETDNEILMIDTNLEREELSPYDRMIAIGRKEELLKIKRQKAKQNGNEIIGSIRSEIAAKVESLSETQIGLYLRIYKKATDVVKQELKNNTITLTTAYKLSSLDSKKQKKQLNEILNPKKKKKQQNSNLEFDHIKDKIQDSIGVKVTLNDKMLTFHYSELSALLEKLHLQNCVK